MRLSIEYQGTAWDSDIRVFTFLFYKFSFTARSVDLTGLAL